MATLHPSLPSLSVGAGAYRERDVLDHLERGLPPGFDVFHNVEWSVMLDGSQRIGEVDIAIVSPAGHLLIVEVKAGAVQETDRGLTKAYGTAAGWLPLDVGGQARRNHKAILGRLKDQGLEAVRVGSLLVLPDHRVQASTPAYPRERIVDAGDMEHLCSIVHRSFGHEPVPPEARQQLLSFLAARFAVVPDVSTHLGQVQACSLALASGLATWVPAVRHASGIYTIEATAGSGKTQLALSLLQQAHAARQRAAYICFNRPLADHIARLAPTSATVLTFHEACLELANSTGSKPDFSDPGVFGRLEEAFLAASDEADPRWDLLVVDETQDFKPAWVEALLARLRGDGRAYLMGDASQQLYERDAFELPEAVSITCHDNFRSPRKVVEVINVLGLAPHPVVGRSPFAGETPGFKSHEAGEAAMVAAVEQTLQDLRQAGFRPDQIVVLTLTGREKSQILKRDKLGPWACKRATGAYDKAGNALWTDGELLVETVYRFKGQSAPAVVLCEIDFQELDERALKRLFVGFTRAQFRLQCVLSNRAAELLVARADNS